VSAGKSRVGFSGKELEAGRMGSAAAKVGWHLAQMVALWQRSVPWRLKDGEFW
jgi:hypothetical protein